MRKRHLPVACVLTTLVSLSACADGTESPLAPTSQVDEAKSNRGPIAINVGLNTASTDEIRAALSEYGTVADELPQLDLVFMTGRAADLPEIEALPFVAFAEPDVEVGTGPLDEALAEDFLDGLSTWNLDAIDVTEFGAEDRQVTETGAGVYVGVLDSGLLHTWRLYFPEERIATEYAAAFSGGWHPNSSTPQTPNVWEQAISGHGTHVTSTIIGYNFRGTAITGVAPEATIIPVKVLGQRGTGWTSMVAAGLVHVADLKTDELSGHPVVINMSLGGGPSMTKRLAIQYALDRGVLIVASAGNNGDNASYPYMGYPGAYEPVISVASAGWGDCPGMPETRPTSTSDCYGQWTSGSWWWNADVAEGTSDIFYISGFSSREGEGQDLDVVAPGHWVLGPYQVDRGAHSTYYYLSGTSMASPHVAGIVALMLERDPALTQAAAESVLESAAMAMAPDTHFPLAPGPACCFRYTWGDDATGHGFITAAAALAGM